MTIEARDESQLEARLAAYLQKPWTKVQAAGAIEAAAQALRYNGYGSVADSAAAVLHRAISEGADLGLLASSGAPILLVHAVESKASSLTLCQAACIVVSACCQDDNTRRKLLLPPPAPSFFATAIALHTLHGDGLLREAIVAIAGLASFPTTHPEAWRAGVPAWAVDILCRDDPNVTPALRVRALDAYSSLATPNPTQP